VSKQVSMKKGKMKANHSFSSLLVSAALPSELGGSTLATPQFFCSCLGKERLPSGLQEISSLACMSLSRIFHEPQTDHLP